MKTRQKAQISSQVFIYIMAAVIIGLIILVGYKGISSIIIAGQSIDISSFKADFSNVISTYSRQSGSQKKFEFSLSDKFDEICFADSRDDSNEVPAALRNNQLLAEYPLIQSSYIESSNVFLLNDKKIVDMFYVEKLDVQEDFLCMKSEGAMSVWVKGTGKVAELFIQNEN